MNFESRWQELIFLIEQRLIIRSYFPDELYGFFNKAGLDYSVDEIRNSLMEIDKRKKQEDINRMTIDKWEKLKGHNND